MKYLLVCIICIFSSLTTIAQDKPVVLATTSMISDIASNILGDKAEVKSLIPLGGDPHLFEATPKSAQQINSADLVLMNGLTLEGWLSKLIENSGTKAEIITTTQGIKPIESLVYTNSADPHAWMDAANVIVYAENILNAAKELSPDSAEYFEKNFLKYKIEIEALDQYIIEKINSIPEKNRILITSHDAFQYYGRKYGLQLESTMGTSTDADVQTSDRIQLEKVIKNTTVPAIFVESTINPKMMEQIAKDLNVKIGGKLYADSLGDEASGADTYIKMMKQNTDIIVSALSKEREKESDNTGANTGFDASIYGLMGFIALLIIVFFVLRKKR